MRGPLLYEKSEPTISRVDCRNRQKDDLPDDVVETDDGLRFTVSVAGDERGLGHHPYVTSPSGEESVATRFNLAL